MFDTEKQGGFGRAGLAARSPNPDKSAVGAYAARLLEPMPKPALLSAHCGKPVAGVSQQPRDTWRWSPPILIHEIAMQLQRARRSR
jgi:hypothetical protein